MSLSVCAECQTIEGSWREPTPEECAANDIPPDDINHTECLVCCDCGAVGSHRGIPEHDDYDMER
jgi:hypothetical protein